MNLNTDTITNSVTTTELFVADEDYTLERLVGYFQWLHSEANAQVKVVFQIEIYPSNTAVAAIAVDGDIVEPDSYWVLYRGQLSTRSGSTPQSYPHIVIPFDLKIRRTIQEGDYVKMRVLSDSATANYMTHVITQFYRRG